MIKVSYIKSDDRSYNVERCLALIKTEITKGLKDAKSVVVKPDCITAFNQLAATNVDALESLLSFIRPHVKGQIVLAEGTEFGDTFLAFKNYDYYRLQDRYDLALIDLNTDDFQTINLLNKKGGNTPVKIANTLLKSDYIISICPPKTNRYFGMSASITNVALSSLRRGNSLQKLPWVSKADRLSFLEDNPHLDQNIQIINQTLKTELTIIDGYEVMEGEGPVNGQMVAGHFSVAGTDPKSVDLITACLLGLDQESIPYLDREASADKIFVIGDDWKKNIIPIKRPFD